MDDYLILIIRILNLVQLSLMLVAELRLRIKHGKLNPLMAITAIVTGIFVLNIKTLLVTWIE